MACSNGYEPKPSATGDIWLDIADILSGAPQIPLNVKAWILGLALPAIKISVDALCSGPPPTPTTFPAFPYLLPEVLSWLRDHALATIHPQYCQCANPTPTYPNGCPGTWSLVARNFNNTGNLPTLTYQGFEYDIPEYEIVPDGTCGSGGNAYYWTTSVTGDVVTEFSLCKFDFERIVSGPTFTPNDPECTGDETEEPDPPPNPIGVPDGSLNLPEPSPIGDLGGGILPPPGPIPEEQPPAEEADPSCCSDLEWVDAGLYSGPQVLTVPARKICRLLISFPTVPTTFGRYFGGIGAPDRLYRLGFAAFQYGSGLTVPVSLDWYANALVANGCGADCIAIYPAPGLDYSVRIGLKPEPVA